MISDHKPDIEFRKGTGLLDVYLNRLRVIIPREADDLMKQTAEHFSKPNVNGHDPTIPCMRTAVPDYLNSPKKQ